MEATLERIDCIVTGPCFVDADAEVDDDDEPPTAWTKTGECCSASSNMDTAPDTGISLGSWPHVVTDNLRNSTPEKDETMSRGCNNMINLYLIMYRVTHQVSDLG